MKDVQWRFVHKRVLCSFSYSFFAEDNKFLYVQLKKILGKGQFSPRRPLAHPPHPLGLVVKRTATDLKKKKENKTNIFSLVDNPLPPPPPLFAAFRTTWNQLHSEYTSHFQKGASVVVLMTVRLISCYIYLSLSIVFFMVVWIF